MTRLLPALFATLLASSGCGSDVAEPEAAAPASEGASVPSKSASVPPVLAAPPVQGPRVRILGTIQDGGLPHAGCTCERCDAARRGLRQLVASIAVVAPAEREAYLVDATPDIGAQIHALSDVVDHAQGKVDRKPLSGIFLTHAHIGHYLGLAHLGFEVMYASGVPVFATPKMAAFLRNNGPWSQLVEQDNIELRELAPGSTATVADIRVTGIKVPHRDEYSDTVGYRIEGKRATVLYIPDTEPWDTWTKPVEQVLEGVDVALLDGTFYSADELPGRKVSEIGHPLMVDTAERLAPLVQGGKLRVYFIHLNHSNPALTPDSPERKQLESRGFRIATEGQEFPI